MPSKHFEIVLGAKESESYPLKLLALQLVRVALAEETQTCG